MTRAERKEKLERLLRHALDQVEKEQYMNVLSVLNDATSEALRGLDAFLKGTAGPR